MRLPHMFAVLSMCGIAVATSAQSLPATGAGNLLPSYVAELGLPSDVATQLRTILGRHDYIGAEEMLLPLVADSAAPQPKARVLSFLGGVYFAQGDIFQAAVAWKKADALSPLPPAVRFTLAMAYVRLGRRDWARGELLKLAAQQPREALFPYWLGRIDYDGQQYDKAIAHFQAAIALDSTMARAHDNLGLCLFYLNRNGAAEEEFRKAIALEPSESKASAWPHLNLALALKFTNRLDEATIELRKAVALDPQFAKAYYELGTTLEQQGQLTDAINALEHAISLDRDYPEPHVALARLLRRSGDRTGSQREVKIYQQLRADQKKEAPTEAGAP